MDNTLLLRRALRANALFSACTGALTLGLAPRIAEHLSLPSELIRGTGAVLLVYGAALGVLASTRRVASVWSVTASLLDLGWVLGSVALLAVHPVPSPALVAVPAVIVLLLALVQLEALRRTVFTAHVGRYALERVVAASADRAWGVVSDVARYAEVAGTLHRSEIVSGSGVGMVRRCEDTSGVCWLETCTRWEPGHAYAFEVDTSGPGYPLPLRSMRGDFEVEAGDRGQARIRIRFSFTPRGGWATELALSLAFIVRGDALVGDILRRWAQRIEASPPAVGAEVEARAVGEGQ